jgi:hypothetical protein
MGCEYDSSVTAHGDRGYDFVFPLTVEVVWLGLDPMGRPRLAGHLIVNPYEPHRWADLYVVVRGSVETDFRVIGWTTHVRLLRQPRKDFGYGPKIAMHTNDLQPIDRLVRLKTWRSLRKD